MNKDPKPITKALADGLVDGGIGQAYNYPGFFSHELFNLLGGRSIQLSEKHAYAEAFGSSLAGKRTAVMFKNVGLNVAADAYLHSVIAGVGAGLVLIIFDDIDVWGSQESQDSRHFLDLYGGLLLEPRSLQEAYSFARNSFKLSETYDTPVVIRITNEHLRFGEKSITHATALKKFEVSQKTKNSFIVHPYYWLEQYDALHEKNKSIKYSPDFTAIKSKTDNEELLVVFGAVNSLLMTLPDAVEGHDVLNVVQLPLHESVRETVKDKKYKHIRVLEYGQPYLWEKISAETMVPVQSITPLVTENARKFELWDRDSNLFEAIHNIKEKGHDRLFVVSDITRFTVEKHEVVDVALSYGSALSVGCGHARVKGHNERTICIVGDGSITHEGLDTINYACANNLDLTLIIVDNGGLWCTGGQSAALGIEKYLERNGLSHQSLNIDLDSPSQIASTIESTFSESGFSILLAKAEMGSLRGE